MVGYSRDTYAASWTDLLCSVNWSPFETCDSSVYYSEIQFLRSEKDLPVVYSDNRNT
jgi:hypothetical protein